MFINHASKQVAAKIVYYGPGLSGKTTNLQYIFSTTNPKSRGELVSMETEIERTLFFDLLPLNVGLIQGYNAKFQLYTVPGQIFYDSTRQLVLKGADGIVFVADSQELMEHANIESYHNLVTNLKKHNQDIKSIPLVFQFNKRDLKNRQSVETLNKSINKLRRPFFEAVATTGYGVIETLREISSLTLIKIKEAIEQTDSQRISKPVVQFDLNEESEIISKEDLPVKKIPANQPEAHRDEPAGEINLPEKAKLEPAAATPSTGTGKKSEIKAASQLQQQNDKPPIKGNLDILNELKDKSRLTILKRIELNDPEMVVEIKDKDSKTIERIDVTVTPETKKVTIILDVK